MPTVIARKVKKFGYTRRGKRAAYKTARAWRRKGFRVQVKSKRY